MIKRIYHPCGTVMLRLLLLAILLSTRISFAQVVNPMQAGVIENGSPISPNLTGAASIYTLGNYAYVVGSSDVLEIFDISLPGTPLHKSSLRNGEGGASILKPLGVVVSGNFAYICNGGGHSVEVVDVSNPAKPVHKTTISHGSPPYLYLPQGIYLSGNYLYLPVLGSWLVEILDISTPGAPVHKGLVGLNGHNPYAVVVRNSIAYVAAYGEVAILDVSNPALPSVKSTLTTGKSGGLVDMRSLALVGNYVYAVDNFSKRIEVIDVSDATTPISVATIDTAPNIPWSVNASGNALYIGYQGNKMEVFDISTPATPVKKTDLTSNLFGLTKSMSVNGNSAFVVDQNTNSMIVLDITAPLIPTIKANVTTQLRSGGALLNDPQSVYVTGNYAYVADKGGNGLEIIDVSDPSTPTHKGSLTNGSGSNFISPTSVFVSGNYAYVVGNGTLEIVDITNPAVPVHKGSLSDGGGAVPYLSNSTSIFVLGDYAYIASSGRNALEIINVSNPAAPVHAAGIQDNTNLVGAQSIHVSTISAKNYAFIACATSNRLTIVDVSNLGSLSVTKTLINGNGTPGNAPYLSEPMSVFVAGNYAYVVSRGSKALEIIDVTTPATAQHKGFLKDGATTVSLPPYLNYPRSVYVIGNTAYVASGYTPNTSFASGLEVIDVTDPANPVHKGNLNNLQQGALLDGPTSIFVAGNYAYITNSLLFTNLNVAYLYGPSITNFTPSSGAEGSSVTVTGQNFNTFVKASINGVAANVISVNATSLTLTVPSGATIGKIMLSYDGQSFASNSNFIVTPVASTASSIQQGSFTANWSNVGAVRYLLDVSADGFATFVNGYNGISVGNVTRFTISGLSPGKTYQYRIRASDGVISSINSNSISTTTLPATPIAQEATFVTQSGFIINWSSAPGASSYAVDVAYDNAFSNFVVGYNNLIVSNATSQVVTGLNPYTKCYYRVRANSSSGSSPSSNIINVTTLDLTPPTITSSGTPNPSKITMGNTPVLNVNVTDNVSVVAVNLFYRGISESTFKTAAMQGPGGAGGNYSITLQTDWYDSLGLEYYFKSTDQTGNTSVNTSSFIQLVTPSLSLPSLPSGTEQSDYRIVAFPYQLATDNKITTVYNNVPWSDNTKAGLWWWNPNLKNGSGDYDQYTTNGNLQTIEPGKGYWVITRTPVSPTLSNVPAPKYNQSNLYAMTLKPGWNQVGNPYPVPVSWDKVIAHNQTNNPGASFGPLTVYDGEGYKSASGSTLLPAFEGGFVSNLGSSDVTIEIPFPGQDISSGRVASVSSDISSENWNMFLHINQDGRTNQLGGFGMHRAAQAGVDRYDNFNPPSFLGIPEVRFTNAEFPDVSFSNDMVSSQDKYTWTFTPHGKQGSATQLTWNNELNVNSSQQLFLLDEELLTVTDMNRVNHYDFILTSKSSFRIFYGSDVTITSSQIVAGSPYPNPLMEEEKATINLALPESSNEYSIHLQIYDRQGNRIASSGQRLSAGIHPIELALPSSLAEGIYIYTLAVTNEQTSSIHTGKIVKP